jgi:hypothetical protein
MLGGLFGGGQSSADAPVLLSPLQVCLLRVKSTKDLAERRALARQTLCQVQFQCICPWTVQELDELLELVARSNQNDAKLDETPLSTVHQLLQATWSAVEGKPASDEVLAALDLAVLDPRADLLKCFMNNRSLIPGKQSDVVVDAILRCATNDADCIGQALKSGGNLGLSLRAVVYLTLIYCTMRKPFQRHDNLRMQTIEKIWIAAVAAAGWSANTRHHINQLMFAELQRAFLGYSKGFGTSFSSTE